MAARGPSRTIPETPALTLPRMLPVVEAEVRTLTPLVPAGTRTIHCRPIRAQKMPPMLSVGVDGGAMVEVVVSVRVVVGDVVAVCVGIVVEVARVVGVAVGVAEGGGVVVDALVGDAVGVRVLVGVGVVAASWR